MLVGRASRGWRIGKGADLVLGASVVGRDLVVVSGESSRRARPPVIDVSGAGIDLPCFLTDRCRHIGWCKGREPDQEVSFGSFRGTF